MIVVKDKKVAVIGLSRTGLASARMLADHGAQVVVSDVKKENELTEELEKLTDLELDFELGGHGEKCLNSDLIVVSPGVPLTIPFFKKAKEKGIPIIGEIELAYHFTEARIIAITGTNGKTTTTALTGEILKKAGIGKVKVAGNIGTPLIQEGIGLTKDDWLVVEISSFQLETIREFRPNVSLYLNFTPDHLDRHKTKENYWLAKKRLFMNQLPDDIAIINGQDPEVVRAVSDCKAKIYEVNIGDSKESNGKVKDSNFRGVYLEDNILFIKDEDIFKVIETEQIPLPGTHNIQNVAFAALTSYLTGASIKNIIKGIEEFKPAAHRLQEVCKLKGDILVVDDSKATNPDAAIKAIKSFDRPLVLIAGGQDRDADFSGLAAEINKKVRTLILTGETCFKMKEEVLKTGFANINIHIEEKMDGAVQTAFKHLKPGDCLLLSPGCPSWDMYSSYKERGNQFKDMVKTRME